MFQRKRNVSVSINDILLIGETLRICMHKDNGQIIQDRRYHNELYTNCFPGSEAVTWVIQKGYSSSRDAAVFALRILQENNIIHNVLDKKLFSDDSQFYRFKKDDDSFPWHEDMAVLMKGQRLYQQLVNDKMFIMMSQTEDNVEYDNSFKGRHLVDWMVNNKQASTRQEAINECRRLLQGDIIHHVCDSYHFKDENLLYTFKMDFTKEFTLRDLIPMANEEEQPAIVTFTGDSTFNTPEDTDKGLIIPGTNYLPNVKIFKDRGMVIKPVTAEELHESNPQFVQKLLRIQSDPVGFGFVIRGDGPTYVKTVDPTGPAAAAGLRIGHYITQVNHRSVLHVDHNDLAHIMLEYTGTLLRLTVMEYRPKGHSRVNNIQRQGDKR